VQNWQWVCSQITNGQFVLVYIFDEVFNQFV
ncbi:hypothetical protein D046_1931, partial [Vibrio parahaemolyticus V-223/04]